MLVKPEATYSEDLYRFVWPDGIEMMLERFSEKADDISCELTVRSAHPTKGGTLVDGKRLLLIGPNSQRDMKRTLEARDEEPDWGGMLEQATTLARRRYREGEPAIDLVGSDIGPAGRYLVRPFVFDDALNIIYGSGDSGKSLFTLAIALCVATGQEVAGLVAERTGPVLYLDWEDSAATHRERLMGLARGLGIEVQPGMIIYRRMTASLKESAREIRKDIANFGAILAIPDSLGMACGGDPSDATAMIQTMVAARAFGIPVLGIHHIAKDAKDKSTPYGSVYASNEARMSWLVSSEREGAQLSMVLTNYKANRGVRHERQSYRFNFTEDGYEAIDTVTMVPLTFSASKTVGDGGQKWLIADFLKRTGASTTLAIGDALGLTRATVRMQLNRHKELFQRDGDNWVVVDTNHPESPHITDSGAYRIRGVPLGTPDTALIRPAATEEEERLNDLFESR